MISEERLKELIEKGGIIYFINNKEVHPLGLDKNWVYVEQSTLKWRRQVNKLLGDKYHNFSELFETKEQAEWARDFRGIERTEYLDLPSWEEFTSEYKYHPISFTSKNGISVIWVMKVLKEIEIRECYRGAEYTIFDKKLTKANYREACEMAKRLFLGEDDDK